MGINKQNGIITLMRGDTFTFTVPVTLNPSSMYYEPYQLTGTDRIYFGLMEPGQSFENAILKQVYDSRSSFDNSGNIKIKIKPSDTLRLQTGKYYYMVKLLSHDDEGEAVVTTLVKPTLFWLDGQTHTADNSITSVVNLVAAQRVRYVTLYADKWVGEGFKYTQVVDVPDVTKNSQVDLTPSGAQLEIFYNNGVMLTTKNEGGVVTVALIGQRLEEDYTIQAILTEVSHG